jgi:cytochrome d ubiquinol oxidase subunit II
VVELWFAILVLMLTAYAVLDGWDIGCGIVQFLVTKSPAERRQVASAIGPLWTWHEVWLVGAGGVLFVAFPTVLSIALPGFYLAVFVLLWCLVGRGLSMEFGGHLDDAMWRTFWDVAFAVSNLLIALLLGAAFGNLLRGVPLGPSGKFSMALFTSFRPWGEVGILDWYTVSVALFAVVCLGAHGATYLALKTEGPVHDRSALLSRRLWLIVFCLMPPITVATSMVRPDLFSEMAARPIAWLFVAVAISGSLAIVAGQRRAKETVAFLGGCAFIAGLLGAAAASVFPVMLHSTFGPAHSVTAHTGAVSGHGLVLATLWWPVAMALSLFYFSSVFRQFRGKVRIANEGPKPDHA